MAFECGGMVSTVHLYGYELYKQLLPAVLLPCVELLVDFTYHQPYLADDPRPPTESLPLHSLLTQNTDQVVHALAAVTLP